MRTNLATPLAPVLSVLFMPACSDSDSGDSTTQGSTSSTDAESSTSAATSSESSSGETGSETTTTSEGTTTGGGAACLPDGIYGKCSENMGCFCLLGATVYQFCTVNCTDSSECGNAADFPGAVPGCFPINPGEEEMICALICTDTAQCPCGLTCMPSGVPNTNICAELQ